MTALLLSVEPSSMISNSRSVHDWEMTLSIASFSQAALLYTAMKTVTAGRLICVSSWGEGARCCWFRLYCSCYHGRSLFFVRGWSAIIVRAQCRDRVCQYM